MSFLNRLNPAQKEAATFVDGSLLILAGAGTGKTQTMISRLVYLISEIGISPESILSLTFTNKAANSMKERAVSMLNEIGYHGALPILSTFHSFGMEFLNEFIDLPASKRRINYRLLDTDDKKEIIKSVMIDLFRSKQPDFLKKKDQEILKEEKENLKLACKTTAKYIEYVKNTLDINPEHELYQAYLGYEAILERDNLIDFDDLIKLPHDILQANPTIAKKVSQKFSYIMIDEYQDTNLAQLKLIKLLCSAHQNIVVVGDDDQSIYSFRHARVQNILGFMDDFKGAKLIRLEENYRSTKTILDLANKVIANNKSRYGKNLYTANTFDDEIGRLDNHFEVVYEIKNLLERGVKPSEISIIYRMNVSANFIEPRLINESIPYKVIGSVPFFERAEIKLLLNYLRLFVEPGDNLAFRKIINLPRRKFGEAALKKLEALAGGGSLFAALQANLASFKNAELANFIELFTSTQDKFALFLKKLSDLNIHKLFDNVKMREENCMIFFSIVQKECGFNADISKLSAFLNKIILQEQILKESPDTINLLSIHASKGLEFGYVFLIDCDSGKMPCTFMGDVDIEEERRLFYVAITRAKQKFYIQSDSRNPSQFLYELNKNDEADEGDGGTKSDETACEIAKNTLVKHKIFGIGKVLSVQDKSAQVNFQGNIRTINISFLSPAVD